MEQETGIVTQQQQPQQTGMTLKQVTDRVNLIHQVLEKVMQEGTHFGKVPGCGSKPVLFKPGADILAVTFRLVPQFQVTKTDLGNGHREYDVTCSMYGANGELLGQGVGSCSTMEKKYRYRKEGETRIENEDIADVHNTVLKMAKKRAHVDATLTVTGAADIFTQDLIDDEDEPKTKKPPVGMPVAKPKQKTEPSGEETAQGVLEKVSTKTGKSKKGPWTKYGLLIDGEWYSTFSETLGKEAEGLQGETVLIEWKADGDFKTATSIAICRDEPNGAAVSAEEQDLLDVM